MKRSSHIPYRLPQYSDGEMLARARGYYELMSRRRSVRDFAPEPVPREAIEFAIRTAGSAPSGANCQPWHFVAVADRATKRQIRLAAETEERQFYEGPRQNAQWLDAIAALETRWRKPFLETAPWLVVVFAEHYGVNPDGSRRRNYYVKQSVGIACGMFIGAVHQMGLATVPYTPSAMGFLSGILERAANEEPYVVFPVGHPADKARVPALRRKSLEGFSTWRLGG